MPRLNENSNWWPAIVSKCTHTLQSLYIFFIITQTLIGGFVMCTNFNGSVFIVENLFYILPEYSIPHFDQTRWSSLRFRPDKKPIFCWKEGKTHKKICPVSPSAYTRSHIFLNGPHVLTLWSVVVFGKSIAAALFKKYDGPCRNNVLSTVPERPIFESDSYLF